MRMKTFFQFMVIILLLILFSGNLAAESKQGLIDEIFQQEGVVPQEELLTRLVTLVQSDATPLLERLAGDLEHPTPLLVSALAELGDPDAVPMLIEAMGENEWIFPSFLKYEHAALEEIYLEILIDDLASVESRLVAATGLLRSSSESSRNEAEAFVLDVGRVTESINHSYPEGGAATDRHFKEWGAALLEINTAESMDVMCSWLTKDTMNWNAKQIVDVLAQVEHPAENVIEKLFFSIRAYAGDDATVQLTAIEALLRQEAVSIERISEYYDIYMTPYDMHELLLPRQLDVKASIDEKLSQVNAVRAKKVDSQGLPIAFPLMGADYNTEPNASGSSDKVGEVLSGPVGGFGVGAPDANEEGGEAPAAEPTLANSSTIVHSQKVEEDVPINIPWHLVLPVGGLIALGIWFALKRG